MSSRFFFFLPGVLRLSRAASVAILPSALFGERSSLGASWVFSFQWCCYLIIDLCSHRFCGSWAPGRVFLLDFPLYRTYQDLAESEPSLVAVIEVGLSKLFL